jgi:hypothetical protein
MEKKKGEKKTTIEKTIPLYPLKAQDALKKLLQVPPPINKKRGKRRVS